MADDGRTYIRLHDGMPDHPKIEPLSDRAFRQLVESWCWSSRHLTDGRVPKTIWNRRGTPATRRELVNAGLVEDAGPDQVQLHDYLEHQRSKAEVEEITAQRRAAKQAASVKGNHRRWHIGPNGRPSGDCELCAKGSQPDPTRDRNGIASGIGGGTPSGSITGIDTGIGIGTVPEEETWGGGVPDTNADTPAAAAPNLDPNNPRCARHAHLPIGDPGPNCRGCRDVRRAVERDEAAAGATDGGLVARQAWRAAVEACHDCDENGKFELPDGTLVRHHEIPEPS